MSFRLGLAAIVLWLAACDSPVVMPVDAGSDVGLDAYVPPPPLPDVLGLVPLEDRNPDPTVVEVDLAARASEASIVDGAATSVLTYNGLLPGPLLHARVGDRVIVHFTNELDAPTIVHWHGLRISDEMDGSPRIQNPVQPGETFTYDFVVPDAGTYWYHTHLGQIEQLERGLYGAIVVHEAEPPVFSTERIFVLDDIRLDAENQVSAFLTSGPDVGRGRIGNTLLCNGRGEPARVTIARGAIERWRVVLSTNALSFGLRVTGGVARVIATDGGLLPEPFSLDRVEIAPGQRYDLEVRAADDASEVSLEAMILVVNDAGEVVEEPFRLVVASVEGETTIAEPIYPTVTLPPTDVTAVEELDWMVSGGVVDGTVQFTINGVPGLVDGTHEHVLLHSFAPNTPVRITLSSDVSPAHPFHIHGQFFQIIERNGAPVFEPGLRDTVEIRGADTATILGYFENPGQWMVHCHISEHSERGMMAEVVVGEHDH